MNKRLLFVAFLVVGFLIVVLVADGVMAQDWVSLGEPGPVSAAGAPIPGGSVSGGSVAALAPASPWNTSVRFVGSTFRPRANTVNYLANGGGGCVYATGGDTSEVWNLPLGLPQGAQVEWLRFYFYDNDATSNMRAWFTKYDLYGNYVYEWGVWSYDGGNGYADVQISPTEVINYNSYSYVLNWRPYVASSNDQLCGMRLYYQAPVGVQ